MANLISSCPRCKVMNEVKQNPCMRLNMGTPVICEKCSLRFHAILSKQDVNALFEGYEVSYTVKGENDYVLKSEFYPNP